MIHIFRIDGARLKQEQAASTTDLTKPGSIWIDVVAPSEVELEWVRASLKIDAETPEEAEDIEASARIYEEGGNLYLRADFMTGRQQDYDIVPAQLVLSQAQLISLHDEDVSIIRLMRMRTRNRSAPGVSPLSLLIDLFAMDIEYSADVLESVHAELKEISANVLEERRGTDTDAAEVIARVARQEELNGGIRRNLMDIRRTLSYLLREQRLDDAQGKVVQQILRDIESLDGHTAFIFDKINFLMDAIIGFININQNKVVKIFSVAAVAMLPPTLIASIYGMNFVFMPELNERWGYPMALALMVISVVLPFWYFRRKGWLK
jgi:magnesium transporter